MKKKTTSKRVSPFQAALEAAEQRFLAKMNQRERAVSLVAQLDAELPAIEATINALRRQLNPEAPVAMPKPGTLGPIPKARLNPHEQAMAIPAGGVTKIDPHEVDYSKMGVVFADGQTTESNGNPLVDIDKIPGVGGGGFV